MIIPISSNNQGTYGKKYDYKFIRIGEDLLVVKSEAEKTYQNLVQENANNGWQFVQFFSAGLGIWGLSRYFKLIFEREKL